MLTRVSPETDRSSDKDEYISGYNAYANRSYSENLLKLLTKIFLFDIAVLNEIIQI